MATRASVNPSLMVVLIALVIATVVFAILVIYKSSEIRKAEEGDKEHRVYKEPLHALESDVARLRDEIASTQAAVAGREREIHRLDFDLLKDGVAFEADGEQLRHGAMGEDLQVDGQAAKAKEHESRSTRLLVSQAAERMKRRADDANAPDRQNFPGLDATIAKRQTEQQQVMAKAQEAETQFNSDMEALNAQQEDLNKKREEAQRQKRANFSTKETNVGQLEDKIRDLLELELRWMTEVEPDGELLELGVEHGFVVANIGSADKVFPGLIFADFQYEKGRYHEKGMLEVIDVDAHIATCRVINEYDPRHYPIARGDKIGNPVFDSRTPKVFVLAGDFVNYNKGDIEDFIRKTGGIVREKLSPGVDFLVAGERSDRQQDNAREYQVVAMKEEQLLRFLQTTFATRPPGKFGAMAPPPPKAKAAAAAEPAPAQ